MFETFGLLFADGSMFVMPEGVTLEEAQLEAVEADFGEAEPRTSVVRIRIESSVIGPATVSSRRSDRGRRGPK